MHYRSLPLVGLSFALLTAAAASEEPHHEFSFGGYVKMDVIATDYEGGLPAVDSPLRDFHIPALVPVGGDSGETLDFHARESRFFLATRTVFDEGPALASRVELDFLLSSPPDERVSNSYEPRLRHFYLEYGNWLFGQTWDTFMIVTLPDDLDFIGAPEGIAFGRQPMIRYTRGSWQLALENPDTTVTPFGGGPRVESHCGMVPDLVARHNRKGKWGELSVAALLRRLAFEDPDADIDATETGFGVNLGGRFPVGERDDVRFQLGAGEGMGRYVALNIANGAVVTAGGELEVIGTANGYIAFRHFWNERWRSTFDVSGVAVDNDVALTGTDVSNRAWSASANLLYSPRRSLTFGVEYTRAVRELESGVDGAFDRLQFSARYDFSFATKKAP